MNQLCDYITDCLDATDEVDCPGTRLNLRYQTQQGPKIIHFDGRGKFIQENMNPIDPCPVTHFRCPRPMYCMPVFLRCNGVKDCPYGEDELKCDHVLCPMYYRCRGSSVCLHPTHVCDGWPQCPQRDDELLCNATCPAVCQCQGLAFVCRQSFSLTRFTELKYLNAQGSGIQPMDVSHNLYLIYLSLASCKVYSWPNVALDNLQKLDLSQNLMTIIFMKHFVILRNLRSLHLGRNPLTALVKDSSDIKRAPLLTIDLSHTNLLTFNSLILAKFDSLETLNLSFSRLGILNKETFSYLPSLKNLDFSGCDIKQFSTDTYAGLIKLQSVKASDYKLCCKTFLPHTLNEKNCFAPRDEISSCDNLLKSKVACGFVWLSGGLTVLGNAGNIIFRLVYQHEAQSQSGFSIFVKNLNFSDFLMGVYLILIGVADKLYSGRYWWYERLWKASLTCKIAGYLSVLSTEVSACMITILTIDRIIALHVPCDRFRFTGRSAMVVSGLTWLCSLSLAAVPLFTVFSHWRFYGRTSICIPTSDLGGQILLFDILILFNFVLFLLVAVVQASIYWSLRTTSTCMMASTNRSLDLVLARRLFTVVVSDCLCWLSIGALCLIAHSGMHVPNQVNVAMAIFVLPLNSALNPLLYTVSTLSDKRRAAREARILKFLESRVKYQQFHT